MDLLVPHVMLNMPLFQLLVKNVQQPIVPHVQMHLHAPHVMLDMSSCQVLV